MWTALGWDYIATSVLDAPLLLKQEDLLPKPIDLRLEPDSGVDAVRGDTTGMGQGSLGK